MIEWLVFLALPFMAVVLDGAYRIVVARMQNRQGPPLLQTWYDLDKLWGKGFLNLQDDPFFRAAPILYFIATLAMFLFVPIGLMAFQYDFIFLIYLTILASAFYVLAGVSSDSPYGIVASMREMVLMVCYEISLALGIFTIMIASGATSFAGLTGTPILMAPFAAIVLFVVVLAETHITPFDTASAETEVLAGAETEYPGKGLFFIEFARVMHRFFYALLLPFLFFGGNIIAVAIGAPIIYLMLAYSKVTSPRYRVDQAWWALFLVLLIALAEFVRVSWRWFM